jgi:hypothetical protein
MANDLDNPFPPGTLEELITRLEELDRADRLIDRSIQAGIDMTAERKKSADLRTQLMRFRQSFFPGQ